METLKKQHAYKFYVYPGMKMRRGMIFLNDFHSLSHLPKYPVTFTSRHRDVANIIVSK